MNIGLVKLLEPDSVPSTVYRIPLTYLPPTYQLFRLHHLYLCRVTHVSVCLRLDATEHDLPLPGVLEHGEPAEKYF